MPTLIHPNRRNKINLPPMTIKDARDTGLLSDKYVPVEKDHSGKCRQMDDFETLQGEYMMLPRNKAG